MQASSQERIAGVVLVLFSLTFLVLAFFIPAPPFKQQLGPEAFPKAIGLALLVLSVVYLVQQTRGRAGEDEARAAIIGAEEKVETPADLRTMAVFVVVMLCYAWAFERLGYALSTFLAFMAGVLYLDRRHLLRDTLMAVAASFVLQYVFSTFLRVRLPAGPLSVLGF